MGAVLFLKIHDSSLIKSFPVFFLFLSKLSRF